MRSLETKNSILQWSKNFDVVICCNVFNASPFIGKAIESFFMQVTKYTYGVYIHDDASNDGTTELLLNYKDRYGTRMYLESAQSNRYSDGYSLNEMILPELGCEFVALCEGDDYWTDDSKIDKQIDALIANDKFSFSAHMVDVKWEDGTNEIKNQWFGDFTETRNLYDFVTVKRFVPLQSIVSRTRHTNNLPAWKKYIPGIHMFLINYLRAKGELHFIQSSMAVHRKSQSSLSLKSNSYPYFNRYLLFRHVRLKSWIKVNHHEIFMYDQLLYEIEDLQVLDLYRKWLKLKMTKASIKMLLSLRPKLSLYYWSKSMVT